MKALARYQVILLGEQRHIRCEQLAQGCCPNSAAAGVEPATSRSQVQLALTTTPPSHLGTEIKVWKTLFSVREGRKIRSCVRYFLGTENSIEYAKCPSPGTENSQRNSLFSFRPSRTDNSIFQTLISVLRDGK